MAPVSAKARRARDTRWMYHAEKTTLRCNEEAVKLRPIKELREIAEEIWKKEAPEGKKFPDIKASNGMKYLGQWCSYCYGYTEIKLARHHRTLLVLLHELTHALGPCVHGPKFVKLYFRLLHKYAGYNKWFLEAVAAEKNITVW